MAQEQISVVKKKTLTLKAPTERGPDEAAPAPRLVRLAAAVPKSSASFMLGGVSAIIAMLCFFALLFMQWTELQYLSAPTVVGQTAAP